MKMLLLALLPLSLWAQQLDLSSLDKLAEKAKESANVSLDETKLKFASQFLSGEDKDQSKAKSLLTGLRGIQVRTFEFDGPGQVNQAELEPLRKQLRGPGWSKIVEVREKRELAEVYIFSKGKVTDGLAVIAMEDNEMTVVNLVGTVELESLMKMGGVFGIPELDLSSIRKPQSKSKPEVVKDDEDGN